MLWHRSCLCIPHTHRHRNLLLAQIEKELRGVVFACSKFRDYIYRKTTVTILKKSTHTAPARLKRMLLQQPQAYDIMLQKG